MKRFLAKYLLYIYNNYIIEEYDIYNKWALPFVKIISFFRKIYIWIASIVFFPIFLFMMNNEKELKEAWKKTENMFSDIFADFQLQLENKNKK
jgi:uncharacterized membrane protein YgaE (UPF0421/DUF939 family)